MLSDVGEGNDLRGIRIKGILPIVTVKRKTTERNLWKKIVAMRVWCRKVAPSRACLTGGTETATASPVEC